MSGRPAYPDRLVEYLFAGMMISWGAWLVAPWWETFGNPAYAALAAIAPEQVWGVLSIGVGAVRLTALLINGRYCRTPIFRFACSLLGVNWWLVLIWLFYLTPQPHPPAGYAFYPMFILFEMISCWRSMADAFHSNAFRPLRLPRILSLERVRNEPC